VTDFEKVDAPAGWEGGGYIPRVTAEARTDDDLDSLTEDLVQISASNGDYIVDLGWYPDADENGRFVGRLIKACDWSSPVDKFATRDWQKALAWLRDAVEEVETLLGDARVVPIATTPVAVDFAARTSAAWAEPEDIRFAPAA
jgi:hypothetical protein